MQSFGRSCVLSVGCVWLRVNGRNGDGEAEAGKLGAAPGHHHAAVLFKAKLPATDRKPRRSISGSSNSQRITITIRRRRSILRNEPGLCYNDGW